MKKNRNSISGVSSVDSAIRANNWKHLLRMLEEGRLNPNYEFCHNCPPAKPYSLLDIAIDHHATELAIWLIGNGADINRKRFDWTPLMCACAGKDAKIVKALISAGANIDTGASRGEEDNKGATALMIAADMGNSRVVKQLLKAGADSALQTSKGQTAAFFAVATKTESLKRVAILRTLVAAGCPLRGNELHRPVYERNWKFVDALIQLGCPTNERLAFSLDRGPRKGETPLTLAVRNDGPDWLAQSVPGVRNTTKSRLRIIKALLAEGANPDLPDAKGWVPLMVVDADEEPHVERLLLDAGADPSLVDRKIVAKRADRKRKFARLLSGSE